MTCRGGRPLNRPVTPTEGNRNSYDVRPYPQGDLKRLIKDGGSLPPLQWMLAIGRPGEKETNRILVAGCGTGVEAFVLRGLLPEAEIVAVDLSRRSIAEAKRLQRRAGKARPIRFSVADLTDPGLLKATGGEFDLITCHGVLSYIPEPEKVLGNLARCLRPDGVLYLGVNGAAHHSTRLRPWLERFGQHVNEMRDEPGLRGLLGLWDSLHAGKAEPLSGKPASYLAGDVCGRHFNNWSLRRWTREAEQQGWDVVATWLLPLALRLMMEGNHHPLLYPKAMDELAVRIDEARPAGFHRILLRRATAVAMGKGGTRWSGLYKARVKKGAGKTAATVLLASRALGLSAEFKLKKNQEEALRTKAGAANVSEEWVAQFGGNEEARRLLWLWEGLGVVARDRG